MANDSNETGLSVSRTKSVTSFLQALQSNILNGTSERREEPLTIKQFQDLKPTTFTGSPNPLVAEA
mgnify:CR=1 FL=1